MGEHPGSHTPKLEDGAFAWKASQTLSREKTHTVAMGMTLL